MDSLVALAIASLLLVLVPGPNAALIVANSLRFGARAGAITVLGTTLGVALQLAVVLLGLAVVLQAAATALTWIRWAGVAYLLWLGLKTWRETAADSPGTHVPPPLFMRACLIACTNPKTLLFNAAFLPQFLSAEHDAGAQLALLAGVFLAVLLVGDLTWVLLARTAQRTLTKYGRVRNRLTGGVLMLAGVGLACSHRS